MKVQKKKEAEAGKRKTRDQREARGCQEWRKSRKLASTARISPVSYKSPVVEPLPPVMNFHVDGLKVMDGAGNSDGALDGVLV